MQAMLMHLPPIMFKLPSPKAVFRPLAAKTGASVLPALPPPIDNNVVVVFSIHFHLLYLLAIKETIVKHSGNTCNI
jgi:hypothetical protein